MSFSCPSSIKACTIAVARANECGVPLDPETPNSRVIFTTFASLELSPVSEDGEDIIEKDACGRIVISDKDMSRLRGFDATLTLLTVPLPVLELMTGATILTDGSGNGVGGVLRDSMSGSAGRINTIVEVWSRNANKDQCGVGGTGSEAYIRWGLPLASGWEVSGGTTFGNEALKVELTGFVERNPNWFPIWPGTTFPSYVPGGGDPDGVPTGAAPTVLPAGIVADPWSLANQTDIQAGGPLYWRTEASIPNDAVDCDYVGAVGS